jgi:hypothetical protein
MADEKFAIQLLADPQQVSEVPDTTYVYAYRLPRNPDGSTVAEEATPHTYTTESQAMLAPGTIFGRKFHIFEAVSGDRKLYSKTVQGDLPLFGLRKAIARKRMTAAANKAINERFGSA